MCTYFLAPLLMALGLGSNNCGTCTSQTCTSTSGCSECSCNNNSTISSCITSSCPGMLGCYRIQNLNWNSVCDMSECEISQTLSLVQNGFNSHRSCPVKTAADFLSSACLPCEFQGKPAYLKAVSEACDKYYVLLGISCVGEVAFELEKVTCPNSCATLWQVCKIAIIC